MSKINGAQSLVNALEAAGVEVMFGIPGGAILPAYDPIFDSKIRHILVRHNKVQVMLQPGMPKQLVELVFVLQPLVLELQIW